jgi:hypothetical protein
MAIKMENIRGERLLSSNRAVRKRATIRQKPYEGR